MSFKRRITEIENQENNHATNHRGPLRFSIDKNLQDSYISPNFLHKIEVHYARIATNSYGAPTFLGIQGKPGEGKSFQVRAASAAMNVPIATISGAELSGPHEGDAINAIKETYTDALDYYKVLNFPPIILIDDFDLSVAAQFSGSQYTVNSQILAGYMMNIADTVNDSLENLRRIPVIVTGNDFSKLYEPLVRQGRFDTYTWAPDHE